LRSKLFPGKSEGEKGGYRGVWQRGGRTGKSFKPTRGCVRRRHSLLYPTSAIPGKERKNVRGKEVPNTVGGGEKNESHERKSTVIRERGDRGRR